MKNIGIKVAHMLRRMMELIKIKMMEFILNHHYTGCNPSIEVAEDDRTMSNLEFVKEVFGCGKE